MNARWIVVWSAAVMALAGCGDDGSGPDSGEQDGGTDADGESTDAGDRLVGPPASGLWFADVPPVFDALGIVVGTAAPTADGWEIDRIDLAGAYADNVAVWVEAGVPRLAFTIDELPPSSPFFGSSITIDVQVGGPHYVCGTLTVGGASTFLFGARHEDGLLRRAPACPAVRCEGTPWAARVCQERCEAGTCPYAHWCDADGLTGIAGCVPGEQCLDARTPCESGASCGLRESLAATCIPEGTAALGARCESALDAPAELRCAEGNACVFGHCAERCDSSECGPNAVCRSLHAWVPWRTDEPDREVLGHWCLAQCDPSDGTSCDAGTECLVRARDFVGPLWECGVPVAGNSLGEPCVEAASECAGSALCAGAEGARECAIPCRLETADGCAVGETCVPSAETPEGWGGCRTACDPLTPETGCGASEVCVVASLPGLEGGLRGHCTPSAGLLEAAECGGSAGACGPGLLCAQPCLNLFSCGGSVPRPNVCVPICGPGDERPCPEGQMCGWYGDATSADIGRCTE